MVTIKNLIWEEGWKKEYSGENKEEAILEFSKDCFRNSIFGNNADNLWMVDLIFEELMKEEGKSWGFLNDPNS